MPTTRTDVWREDIIRSAGRVSRSAEEGDTTKVARASAEDHINDLCLDEEKCWEGMIDLISYLDHYSETERASSKRNIER